MIKKRRERNIAKKIAKEKITEILAGGKQPVVKLLAEEETETIVYDGDEYHVESVAFYDDLAKKTIRIVATVTSKYVSSFNPVSHSDFFYEVTPMVKHVYSLEPGYAQSRIKLLGKAPELFKSNTVIYALGKGSTTKFAIRKMEKHLPIEVLEFGQRKKTPGVWNLNPFSTIDCRIMLRIKSADCMVEIFSQLSPKIAIEYAVFGKIVEKEFLNELKESCSFQPDDCCSFRQMESIQNDSSYFVYHIDTRGKRDRNNYLETHSDYFVYHTDPGCIQEGYLQFVSYGPEAPPELVRIVTEDNELVNRW